MVFDFFKKRTTEGIDQLSNLADAAAKGRLSEGLIDAATYTSVTNKAFADGLAKSRNRLLYDLDAMLNGGGDILEDLEDILLQSDIGLSTAEDIVNEVKSLREGSTRMFSRDDLRSIMRGKLIEALDTGLSGAISFADDDISADFKMPTVLFVMGANGMGKTTTIGKLANRLRVEGGQKVLLAACDTFRAGAVEQLEMWASRAEVGCFSPNEKQTTPSAVLYGALDETLAAGYDTLIVDTSGRLSNNDALTAELAKMKRVIQKRLSIESDGDGKPVFNTDVPQETLLVIDAAQGRMALDSAKVWNKEIGLSGLILTKLDGSAKGGSVVAVSRELGLPVKLIGVGEGIDDLRDFNPEQFVDGLLGIGSAGGSTTPSSANEGAALASRLVDMRKERDERSKAMKKEKASSAKVPAGVGLGSSAAGDLTFQEMDTPADGMALTGNAKVEGRPKPGRGGKKNKKKKKRKGRR